MWSYVFSFYFQYVGCNLRFLKITSNCLRVSIYNLWFMCPCCFPFVLPTRCSVLQLLLGGVRIMVDRICAAGNVGLSLS